MALTNMTSMCNKVETPLKSILLVGTGATRWTTSLPLKHQ